MYKVLIADDEPRIGNLIKELIQWEELGLEFDRVCLDGMSTYQAILEDHPDIVITDIRMPVLSGLDLIRKVREEGIPVHFIVISGYRYFDYAHSALKYGVEDYLLKPIEEEELNQTLAKLCERRNSEKEEVQQREKIERQYKRGKEYLHREIIRRLLQRERREVINRDYDLEFQEGMVAVSRISVDYTHILEENEQRRSILSSKIIRILEKEMKPVVREMIISQENGEEFLILLNFPTEEEADMKKACRNTVVSLNNMISDFQYHMIFMALSSFADKFEAFGDLIRETEVVLSRKIMEEPGALLRARGGESVSEVQKEQPWTSCEEEIEKAIEIFQTDRLRNCLELCFEKIGALRPEEMYGSIERLIEFLAEKSNREEMVISEEQSENLKKNCRHLITLSCVKKYLVNEVCKILEQHRAQCEERELKPVKNAVAYIQKHYSEKITLELLALENGFNVTYFSELFKKETGKNFSDYLTEIRMKEAKSMLRSSRLTIYEIAEKVGYRDSQYFSKQFEKNVGMKPKQYRKIYY